MNSTLPGTVLPLPEVLPERPFSLLEPVFAVSGGGLLLSQVTELTRLSPATVQNWVKRGWVSAPVNKRYGEGQVARILLINLLRPAMRLDQIASLLRYVNGSVDDRTDDILPDDQLYNWLCTATLRLREESALNHEFVTTLIEALLEGYEGPVPDAKERLSHALTIMLLNVAAAALMQEADALMAREVSPDESPVPRNHGSSPAKNKRKV